MHRKIEDTKLYHCNAIISIYPSKDSADPFLIHSKASITNVYPHLSSLIRMIVTESVEMMMI